MRNDSCCVNILKRRGKIMKAMKKVLVLLLAAIIAFGMIACGKDDDKITSGDDPKVQDNDSGKKDTSSDKGSGEKVKLTFSIWGGQDEQANTQETVDKFNASQDRIEVEVMAIPWENYLTKLNSMATANELPDTGMMMETAVIPYAKEGMFADVSDMFKGQKVLDSLAFTYDGEVMAYSSANEILLLYYNRDMFDAANIAYPPADAANAWTWDEFVQTAKLLTLDSNGKNATEAGFDANKIVQYGCSVENLMWQLEVWALSNGAGYFSEDGKELLIDDPATIEALQSIADLYLVDKVAPLSTGTTDDGIPRTIITGTVAMATNGQWNVGTSLKSARDEGLNYGVGVLPYMKEKVTICTGGPTVVFAQTKYPEEAKEFLSWYNSIENSWGLIKDGIWMPIFEEYYTDEALTRKWVENEAFPPYDEYKSAVVDYAVDYTKSAAWYYTNNIDNFYAVLGSVLGEVWTGGDTVENAIKGNIDVLRDAFEGK